MLYQNADDQLIFLRIVFYNDTRNPSSWTENGETLYLGGLSVIPAMDSNEDDILIRLQFSNDLVLPVRNPCHQVIVELQLFPHLLHDVFEEPKVDWELTWTEVRRLFWFCLLLSLTYIKKPVMLIFLNVL